MLVDKIYREFDSSAINLISAWEKVQTILEGKIPTPEVVEIFPTNFSNYHCPHCRFQTVHGTEISFMPFEAISKLLHELKDRQVKYIELSGGGEPLLHPNIDEIIDLMISLDLRVGLITNGSVLINNDRLLSKLLKCCNWIRFSIDGFTDETYRRVHGLDDFDIELLFNTISKLVQEKNDLPRIGLKILVSNLNQSDAIPAIRKAKELHVDYLQLKYLSFPQELVLPDKKQGNITKKIKKEIKENYEDLVVDLVPAYKGTPPIRQKCLMTFLHPLIDWDGQIYICAFFNHRKKQHSIGNIKEDGFFKHWDSPDHMEVFQAIDPMTCMPNCPMLRYQPVIEFIQSDWYRFGFI